jgi:hypothetical protein
MGATGPGPGLLPSFNLDTHRGCGKVNGKLRGRIEMSPGTPEAELKERALANEKVQPFWRGSRLSK